MANKRIGAFPAEWHKFNSILGLGEDLLPIVCDTTVPISPISDLKEVGKVPSRINNGYVSGIHAWPQHVAKQHHIRMWCDESRYGLCIIARNTRAIDVDITDPDLARKVWKRIARFYKDTLGVIPPKRFRQDSSKFLVPVRVSGVPGDFIAKSTIKAAAGIIEILGNLQQFVAAGTHKEGCRYEWENLGDSIPELTYPQFDFLIKELQKEFGTMPMLKAREAKRIEEVNSPLFNALMRENLVMSQDSQGAYNIVCPFEDEHSENQHVDDSSTQYFPPHTGGHEYEAIKCLHAHCAERNTTDFMNKVGLNGAEDFEDISHEPQEMLVPDIAKSTGTFTLTPVKKFAANGKAGLWLCEDVLPFAEIGMLYGNSASGKTFIVYDLICAIARGVPWHGQQTLKSKVLYVCAEGQNFFRNRIKAYAKKYDLEEADIDVWVVEGRLDLTNKENVDKLIMDVRAAGIQSSLIVIDTYALCMSGDENDGRDTNKVIANCKRIHKHMGAMVLLVHHAGKAGNTGERGHSALRGACDVMLECLRDGDLRGLRVEKMKDGQDHFTMPFTLEDVFLGVTDDAKAITSCVIAKGLIMPEKSSKTTSTVRKWQSFEATIKNAIIVVQQGNKGIATLPKVAVKVLEHYGEVGDAPEMYYAIRKGINQLIVQGLIWATEQGLQIPYNSISEATCDFTDESEYDESEDPVAKVCGIDLEGESIDLEDPGEGGLDWSIS